MKENTQQPEFLIQRIYIKDISFESPSAPAVFKENIQPTITFNIQTKAEPLELGVYEIVLTATIAAHVDKKSIFLIELKQGGIFSVNHIPEEHMPAVLNITCPTILFPYLRETVSDLAAKGGFSNFYLAPVNFEALYLNEQKQSQKQPA